MFPDKKAPTRAKSKSGSFAYWEEKTPKSFRQIADIVKKQIAEGDTTPILFLVKDRGNREGMVFPSRVWGNPNVESIKRTIVY